MIKVQFSHGLVKNWLKLLIEEDESINKIKVRKIRKKNQHSASASVFGQRPNFTIAYCSALANCEKCSFGHCLIRHYHNHGLLRDHNHRFSLSFSASVITPVVPAVMDIKTVGAMIIGIVAFLCIGITSSIDWKGSIGRHKLCGTNTILITEDMFHLN